MQEHTVTAGHETHALPDPFFVIATQNPLEMEGTYPLPKAQMDRFLFQLNMPFPDRDGLIAILALTTGPEHQPLHPVIDRRELIALREMAKTIPVALPVAQYAAKLVLDTHPENPGALEMVKQYVRYGASPRGAQGLIAAGKIAALLDGRYNVAFDDIRGLARRICLSKTAENEYMFQEKGV